MEIYRDDEGEMIRVEEREDGSFYGQSNSFDFEAADRAELESKLNGWGCVLIGHES